MNIFGLDLKDFKIRNYYAYLMFSSIVIITLSLIYDLKTIDNLKVIKISVLVLICSIFIWLLEAIIKHINIYSYEKSIQNGMELTADKRGIRLKYNKHVFILSIVSAISQSLIWAFVIVLSYFLLN